MDIIGKIIRDAIYFIVGIIIIIIIIVSSIIYSNYNKINNIEKDNILLKDSINTLNNHINTIELNNKSFNI